MTSTQDTTNDNVVDLSRLSFETLDCRTAIVGAQATGEAARQAIWDLMSHGRNSDKFEDFMTKAEVFIVTTCQKLAEALQLITQIDADVDDYLAAVPWDMRQLPRKQAGTAALVAVPAPVSASYDQQLQAGAAAFRSMMERASQIEDDTYVEGDSDSSDWHSITAHVHACLLANLTRADRQEGFLRALSWWLARTEGGEAPFHHVDPIAETARSFAFPSTSLPSPSQRQAALLEGQAQFKAMKTRAYEIECETWTEEEYTADYAAVTKHVEAVLLANLLSPDAGTREGFLRSLAYILVCQEAGMHPGPELDLIAETAYSFEDKPVSDFRSVPAISNGTEAAASLALQDA